MTKAVVSVQLLEAISRGDDSEVRRLVRLVQPAQVQDDPLRLSVGHPEIARTLVKWGCDPRTGLWSAGLYLDAEFLTILLEAGADLRAQLHGRATVVVAALSGYAGTGCAGTSDARARSYLKFMSLILCRAMQTAEAAAATLYTARGVVRERADLRKALGVGWRVYRHMKRTIEGAQKRVGVPPDWTALFRGAPPNSSRAL